MNVSQLATLIRTGLDAAGHTTVPVVLPGTAISKLPCVVLAPGDNELGDGNRSLRYGFDVTPAVHRNNQAEQYAYLCQLEAVVFASLIPNQVRFDGPSVFASTGGEQTGEPPALARVIPVSFVADVHLC